VQSAARFPHRPRASSNVPVGWSPTARPCNC